MSHQQHNTPSQDLSSEDNPIELEIEEEFNSIFVEGKDPKSSYYMSYCQLYVNNLMLQDKVKSLVEGNQELINQIKEARKVAQPTPKKTTEEEGENEKMKRSRRTAMEITRHYRCQHCSKSYGSEGSLNQHIRIKHNVVHSPK